MIHLSTEVTLAVRRAFGEWTKIAKYLKEYPKATESRRRRILGYLRNRSKVKGSAQAKIDDTLSILNRINNGEEVLSLILRGYEPVGDAVALENKIEEYLTQGIESNVFEVVIEFKKPEESEEELDEEKKKLQKLIDEKLTLARYYGIDSTDDAFKVYTEDEKEADFIKEIFNDPDLPISTISINPISEKYSMLTLLEDDYKEEFGEYPSYLIREKLAMALAKITSQLGKEPLEVAEKPEDIRDILDSLEGAFDDLKQIPEEEKYINLIDEKIKKLKDSREEIEKRVEDIQQKIDEFKNLRNPKNKERGRLKINLLQNKLDPLKEIVKEILIEEGDLDELKKLVNASIKSYEKGSDQLINTINEFTREASKIRRATVAKQGRRVKQNPEYNRLMAKLIKILNIEASEVKKGVKIILSVVKDIDKLFTTYEEYSEELDDMFSDKMSEELKEGKTIEVGFSTETQRKRRKLLEEHEDLLKLLKFAEKPTYTKADRGQVEALIRQIYKLRGK